MKPRTRKLMVEASPPKAVIGMAAPQHADEHHANWTVRAIAAVALLLIPAVCIARMMTVPECSEGGDFIRNAALARDGGMSEERFIGRVQEDLILIRAFPPHMRWFVQDEEDEALLLTAATDVFRKPRGADAHRADFLQICLARTTEQPGTRL